MKKLFYSVALLSLGACSGTVPVSGETADGERFNGTFSTPGDGRGGGALSLRGDKGVACDGRWQLDEDRAGAVFITCDDGRTGTAELSTNETPGTMRGMLGGKLFKGTFDDPTLAAGK
ncbi:MAG: hypothetical protein J0H97_15375 [Alphaproteobacteria bacterium]|nr:hypothetical protein [Alphaproteobacteria bacterium]